MSQNSELTAFRDEVLREVDETCQHEEDVSREEAFSRYAIARLEEAGDVENARECRDVKEDKLGRPLHRLNGYALSEAADTLDLFVTIFSGGGALASFGKSELASACSQARRFLKNALNGYVDEVEESSPVFDLALTLRQRRADLVRVNVHVLSDGLCTTDDVPADETLHGALVQVFVRDLDYLAKIAASEQGRVPIELDFEELVGQGIPCLPLGTENDVYASYLAIIPGSLLAQIYQQYGARLLEQNVRAFLQFTGKINKGIRDTILKEPHMFFAFNNGIAATAESVELDTYGGEHRIRRVCDLQIVNGGQTTASIFHTGHKDKASLEALAIPMKLTVVRQRERFGEIVSRIARYANSQNKVTDADLTSNNPFLIALEQLSGRNWTPARPGVTYQTRWFFERARGQFKNAMSREGYTPKRKRVFLEQHPKGQMFDKEDVAKFVATYDGKPWMVVRGRQKNYSEFVRDLKNTRPGRAYFEDLVAKAILYRTAEKLYGTRTQEHCIGDMRFITVPYAIAWLQNRLYVRMGRQIDLYQIWREQQLSKPLATVLREVMVLLDGRIKREAPGGLVQEWAKKPDCWEDVRAANLDIDLTVLENDLASPSRPRPVYTDEQEALAEAQELEARVRSLPHPIWTRIRDWYEAQGKRPEGAPDLLWRITQSVRTGMALSVAEREHGARVLGDVVDHAPELLSDADEIADAERQKVQAAQSDAAEMTRELAGELMRWDRRARYLYTSEYETLKRLANAPAALTPEAQARLLRVFRRAVGGGFEGAGGGG